MNDELAKPDDQPPATSEEQGGEEGPQRPNLSDEELRRVLDAHAEWVSSNGRNGTCADLTEHDLEYADFDDAMLQRASFRRANLKGAKFRRAKLQEAMLWDANLEGAVLDGSDFQEAQLINACLKEVSSKGGNFPDANLYEANLQDAWLQGANLQRARLSKANLQSAFLSDANLRGADLTLANLRGADLRKARFEGRISSEGSGPDPDLDAAVLDGADFRNARLGEAKLSDVTGLQADRLGGADLSGAWIPESIEKFAGLEQAAEISRNARKTWLAMLLGCVYAWLTVATTTDVRLLTNSASSPLPIIQTEIPIAWFYLAAPLILLSLYFYLHLYLQDLWRALAALPARFPDSKSIVERAYPWLVIGLVYAHFPRLHHNRPAMSRLGNFVSIILAWWFVPLTLLVFWVRYLPRQNWWGTGLQIVCLVVAAAFGLWSYLRMRRTLRHVDGGFEWRRPWREGRAYVTAAVAAFAVAMTAISWGSINGVRSDVFDFEDHHTWVPSVAKLAGYDVFANFREAAVSTKPVNFWEIAEGERAASVAGANLLGASLRHANAHGAYLTKADLRSAHLEGAILRRANLEGANLAFADLEGAILSGANLVGANLVGAKLLGANLMRTTGLTCESLQAGQSWEFAYRDEACGAPIPDRPAEP